MKPRWILIPHINENKVSTKTNWRVFKVCISIPCEKLDSQIHYIFTIPFSKKKRSHPLSWVLFLIIRLTQFLKNVQVYDWVYNFKRCKYLFTIFKFQYWNWINILNWNSIPITTSLQPFLGIHFTSLLQMSYENETLAKHRRAYIYDVVILDKRN